MKYNNSNRESADLLQILQKVQQFVNAVAKWTKILQKVQQLATSIRILRQTEEAHLQTRLPAENVNL